MSQHMHEEFEIGHHLDQSLRTALTGVAQLVERISRSGAERDRAAAQALREHLLLGRATLADRSEAGREESRDDATIAVPPARPDPTRDPDRDRPLSAAAQRYYDRAPAGSDAGRTAAAWETALRDLADDPADKDAAVAAADLNTHSRQRHGVDLGATVAAAVSDAQANAAADAASTSANDTARVEEALIGASAGAAVPLVMRTADADLPVLATGGPVPGDDGAHYVPTVTGAHVPVDSLVLPSRTALGYVPAWEAGDGQVDRAVFDQLAGASAGPAPARVLPAYRENHDRGVSPTKAATPDEATHRRQAWSIARAAWEADAGGPARGAEGTVQRSWDDLPMQTKTDLFWKQYDTQQARTLPPGKGAPPPPAARVGASAVDASERGMAPSKASTAEERAHRAAAWAMAEASHAAVLPAGTSPEQAKATWKALDWQERGLHYWTAYDHPTLTRPGPGTDVEGPITRERTIELNGQAADYFASQATPNSKGGQYLQSRLGADVVAGGRWQLGYAPAGWTGLTDQLRRGGASDEEIVAAGLGRVSSRGNVVDAFRDRATVSIRDDDGQVLGFVGRDLSGSPQAPKYVNTGETPAYTKGDHLLGLHEAPEGARLVRVEGPFDAIATTVAGQGRYAGVAPLGTALTATQADTLAARSGGRVWTALDGDPAGSKATEADFWMLTERGVDARALPMLRGSDPAQLWRDDPEMFRTLLDVGDAAPTAGVAVIDNTLRDLRGPLRAGDADAFDELAATQDRVAAALPADADRDQLARYTTTSVDQLLERADQARTVADRLDVLDDHSQVAAERTASPARAEDLDATAQRAITGREQAAGRGGDFDAAAAKAAVEQAPARRYDRGAVAPGATVSEEATVARQASGAGFSRPTRDMLVDAQCRAGTPARPATQPGQTLGRPRTQRR